MVAARPGPGDVHGTGKRTAHRHRSRFRQYLPSVYPVRFSPARFSPVRFSYGPGFIRRFQLSVSPVRFSSVRFTPIRFSYGPDFIRRFQLHGYFTFFLRPDPVTDMPPRDHPPPSGHPSPLALRALGSRGDTPRQPGLFLLRQRLSFLILTFHIFPVCRNGFFPELPYCLHLTNLNQPATHSSGHLCRALHFNPYHHSAPQRQRIPRFGAVVAGGFRCCPSERPLRAVSPFGSVPQRQRFPRFGAVAADRCGKAGIGAAAVFATGRDVDREAKCVRQKGTVHEKRDNQAGKDTDSKKRTVGRLWETGPVERAWAGTNASVDETKALL